MIDPVRLVVSAHDGSPGADLALRWAAGLALRVDSRLRIVRIWQVRDVWDEAVRESAGARSPSPEQLVAIARRRLAADTAAVLGRSLEAELRIARGPDEAGLILKAAADADLLVLGSVAARCTREAPCPVVVVPRRLTSAGRHTSTQEDDEPVSAAGGPVPSSPRDGGVRA